MENRSGSEGLTSRTTRIKAGTPLGLSTPVRTAALLVVLVFPLTSFAVPGGISGYSGKAGGSICTSCHAGGAATAVALAGPATLTAGMSGNYTVTITGGPAVNAGMDASLSGANSGSASFTAGAGSKVLNGEVVQSAAKAFTGSSAIFSFAVTAPLTAGPMVLSVAGLSSNNNVDPSGDGAAMNTLTITVRLPVGTDAGVTPIPDAGVIPLPMPDAGNPTPTPTPSADADADADAGTATVPKDRLPTNNGNHYNASPQSDGVVEGESGCSTSGGMPMVVLVAFLGGALLGRSRGRSLRCARNKNPRKVRTRQKIAVRQACVTVPGP